MKNYFIKIALRGVSPMVWRRLRIPGDTSLAQLHVIIQKAYHWDDDHLHQFHIYGKDYGIAYVGGISFADNAHRVFFEDFEFDVGDKFTYEYNFYAHWMVDIRVERITTEAIDTRVYCLSGNGMPGADKHDVTKRTLDFIQALAKSLKSDSETISIKKLLPFVDALNAVRFNHHVLNKRLQSEEVEAAA